MLRIKQLAVSTQFITYFILYELLNSVLNENESIPYANGIRYILVVELT